MKRTFITLTSIAAFGATFFVPAHATTFSPARLIYVAAGVADSDNPEEGTSVPCTNLSGQTATVKVSFFDGSGAGMGSLTLTVAHGRTMFVGTQNGTILLGENTITSAENFQGRVAVYSTQSEVFCSALLATPTLNEPQGLALHMVRFNAHPGTVE